MGACLGKQSSSNQFVQEPAPSSSYQKQEDIVHPVSPAPSPSYLKQEDIVHPLSPVPSALIVPTHGSNEPPIADTSTNYFPKYFPKLKVKKGYIVNETV